MKETSLTSKIKKLVFRAKGAINEKGIYYVLRMISKIIIHYPQLMKRKAGKYKTFKLNDKDYSYFYNIYNVTWMNERCVEVPVVMNLVNESKGKNILEIGNVLPYYFSFEHDILDKYEKAKGVINKDIIEFKTKNKYDLVVSISTFEHIGWDETPRKPEKIITAIKNLKEMLSPKGKIIITCPLGHNHFLDDSIFSGRIKFDKMFFMKRISKDNRWIEITKEQAKASNFVYARPYPYANGLFIGIIQK